MNKPEYELNSTSRGRRGCMLVMGCGAGWRWMQGYGERIGHHSEHWMAWKSPAEVGEGRELSN